LLSFIWNISRFGTIFTNYLLGASAWQQSAGQSYERNSHDKITVLRRPYRAPEAFSGCFPSAEALG
jgi:hypothetical protein